MRKALTCVILAGAVPALAQLANPETNPETIVVTATRVAQPVEQAPATITVLTQTALQQQGAVNLADVFAAVPGLELVQSGPAGQPASLFVRGADSDLVLVLRDGVPVNDGSSPAGAFDFGEDLTNDIGRIEIMRGPDSGLYGSAAIGGVVAISTPQGTAKPVAAIGALAGSQATLWGSANAAGTYGKFDYALGGVSGSTAGFDITPRRMTYYAGHNDGERAVQGYLNLGYTPLPLTRFGLIARGRDTTEGYNELGFDTANATARLNNNFVRASADSTLFDGEWQTSLALSNNHDDRNYVQLLDPLDPSYSSEVAHYRANAQLLQWNNKLAMGNGALDFGGEYGAQNVAVNLYEGSDYGPYSTGVTARRNTAAGYIGAVQNWRRLTISINGRQDGSTGEDGAFTWRAGAVLAIPEVFSHLRVSYGTGYKAPSLYDLYGVDSDGYFGNPALKPEKSQGAEIGWRTDWKALTLDVAAFDQKIHDLIEDVDLPDYDYTPENVDRAQIDGVEATLTWRFAGSDVQISATHLDPRDLTNHVLLLRRARNQIAGLAHLRWRQVTLVPEVTYTGKSYDYLYGNSGSYLGEGFGQSGTVTNLTLTYDVNSHLTLQLIGKNIFNSRFEQANGYQIAGAQILVGATGRF